MLKKLKIPLLKAPNPEHQRGGAEHGEAREEAPEGVDIHGRGGREIGRRVGERRDARV